MAKIAHGIADDLLTTTALATTARLVIAPAMNVNMYENAATQQNMETLKSRGIDILEAESGYLACGDVGKGRLADPQVIADAVLGMLAVRRDMVGKRVLITTGPTEEPIDAVRYITNPSSGKTGFALAQAAIERGAEVDLVTGPVALGDLVGVRMHRVRTAQEMFEAVDSVFDECDIAIFAAAVSDYRPAQPSDHKLKKGEDDDKLATIELVKNPDILATMGARKQHRTVIGFAAETDDVAANARKKLASKNADMIVANAVSRTKGFGTDDNEATFVYEDRADELDPCSKQELANKILDAAVGIAR